MSSDASWVVSVIKGIWAPAATHTPGTLDLVSDLCIFLHKSTQKRVGVLFVRPFSLTVSMCFLSFKKKKKEQIFIFQS